MEAFFPYWQMAIDAWYRLPHDTQFFVWAAGGIVWVLFLSWASARLVAHGLGYRKFRGSWYSPERWRRLMELLAEEESEGRRVLSYDEIRALSLWRYGKFKPVTHYKRGGGYGD